MQYCIYSGFLTASQILLIHFFIFSTYCSFSYIFIFVRKWVFKKYCQEPYSNWCLTIHLSNFFRSKQLLKKNKHNLGLQNLVHSSLSAGKKSHSNNVKQILSVLFYKQGKSFKQGDTAHTWQKLDVISNYLNSKIMLFKLDYYSCIYFTSFFLFACYHPEL